jgi:hypothetical protein
MLQFLTRKPFHKAPRRSSMNEETNGRVGEKLKSKVWDVKEIIMVWGPTVRLMKKASHRRLQSGTNTSERARL